MRRAGASSGLVNAGGDIFAFGPGAWPVTVVHPLTRQPLVEIELCEEALATSALLAGGSGDHLPGKSEWISVTVNAPSASDADALAKIAWTVLQNSDALLSRCGARAFGIRRNGLVEEIAPDRVAA